MHPENIKAAMRIAGTTPAMLADELEVSRSTVSQVMSGNSTSARIQKRIAEITGISVNTLWPPKPHLVLRRAVPMQKTTASERREQARRERERRDGERRAEA